MATLAPIRTDLAAADSIVVVGLESAGKSQLISALTGKSAYVSNYRGSTVGCECYQVDSFMFVDTPGLLVGSDTETTRLALDEMRDAESLLVVVKATAIAHSIGKLLPLVRRHRLCLVVTFADKLDGAEAARQLEQELAVALGAPVVALDARRVTQRDRDRVMAALSMSEKPAREAFFRIRSLAAIPVPRSCFDWRYVGMPLALLALLAPAVVSVFLANTAAGIASPVVEAFSGGANRVLGAAPGLVQNVLIGRYGLVTMGPLMLVWALPTVLLFSVLMGMYKASGLLDRLTVAVHPAVRRLGLSGRDVVHVMMGFGCNVPAVISTRGCSRCNRDTCISAIAFGSACSYQLGATLAVFAATGNAYLVMPYMAYLCVTTLLYIKLMNVGKPKRDDGLLLANDSFLVIPSLRAVWRESRGAISHFLRRALPIFFLITLIASVLDTVAVWDRVALVLSPVMKLLGLPADAAVPIVLSSVRKDGILLFGGPELARQLSPGQLLTAVYFAGVMLPCLVTVLTMIRERNVMFGGRLIVRQAAAALTFSIILAWTIRLLGMA